MPTYVYVTTFLCARRMSKNPKINPNALWKIKQNKKKMHHLTSPYMYVCV